MLGGWRAAPLQQERVLQENQTRGWFRLAYVAWDAAPLDILSQIPRALSPSFPLGSAHLSVWLSTVVHNIKAQFSPTRNAICGPRRPLRDADEAGRYLQGCEASSVSPVQLVSWGRSNPVKQQLYLQIKP